jgi:hypothetical protein
MHLPTHPSITLSSIHLVPATMLGFYLFCSLW